MMLRVGDAFVPELNTWAMAVTYATDIGASVVNISGGGGLTNPSLSRDAMQYAYDNDVTIIASNSDLDSFHHNYPNTSAHAISVHAIVYDAQSINSSTTFFNYNTCTNYGAQLMLSIPANGCSSEAAGRSGGLAGPALLGGAAGGAARRRQGGRAPPDGGGGAPDPHRHRATTSTIRPTPPIRRSFRRWRRSPTASPSRGASATGGPTRAAPSTPSSPGGCRPRSTSTRRAGSTPSTRTRRRR